MHPKANPTPWATLFFALLGLIWCGYMAFPTGNPAPCLSSGCALFRDFRFVGVSLWWVGGAYFFLLAILCLKGNRSAVRILAMLALFADAFLLLVMFFTASCVDCLVVGAIMGLCYYTSLRPSPDSWFTGTEATPSILLPVWFGLFLGNAVLAVDERIPQYALGNTRTSEVRVYFSPSCKACREAISALGNAAALYPVMENEQDFDAIVRFAALLKVNVPVHEAILRSINEHEPTPLLAVHERAILRLQLLRNKAHLFRQGVRTLPLVQVNGWPGERPSSLERPAAVPHGVSIPVSPALPRGQIPPHAPATHHEGEGFDALPLPDFLANPDALEQCGGDRAPCE